jgi:hypothetical protein
VVVFRLRLGIRTGTFAFVNCFPVDFLTLLGAVARGFAARTRFGAFVGALFITALAFCGGFVWFIGHNDGVVKKVNGT